jgi:IS605 OrfB family transposase
MTKVTRILPVVVQPNAAKHEKLIGMASECGKLRSYLWRRFDGISYAHKSARQVRDILAKENTHNSYALQQRVWRACVEDCLNKISAAHEAQLVSVRSKVHNRTVDETERKRLYTLLRKGTYRTDPWLHRHVRKAHHTSRSHRDAKPRLVFDNYSYDTELDSHGRTWISVMSSVRGERIRLCLGVLPEHLIPTTTIELIHNGKRWSVHAAFEEHTVTQTRSTNSGGTVGVDAGVTEILTDSNGNRYGVGSGKKLYAETEKRTAKLAKRAKLRKIRDRHAERAAELYAAGRHQEAKRAAKKARRITDNNLGKRKLTATTEKLRIQHRDAVFRAVHELFDNAASVVAEKLSAMGGKSKYGRRMSRLLSSWQRSHLSEALEAVSRRRGSSVTLVNPAYTSQHVFVCGHLGVRSGDRVHCETENCSQRGVMYDADINAALNILWRANDPRITVYTPYREVKRIIEETPVENCPTRTRVGRVALLPSSTVSETPSTQVCLG